MVTPVKQSSKQPESSSNDNKTETTSPLLPPERLKKLYGLMLRSRMVIEVRGRRSPPDGARAELGCALGLEATEVAASLDLISKDTLVPCGRELPVRVAAGESLNSIFHQERRTGKNSNAPSGSSINVLSSSSRSTVRLSLGTGVALAYTLLKKRNVVVTITNGMSAEGETYRESLTIAANQKLPIVFVMVEDLLETTSHYGHDLWADPNVLPTIVVDGNDPVAVYRVAHEAIDHARTGGGPTIIECRTHRWHLKEDSTSQRQHDPIARLETYLKHKQLWSDDWKASLVRDIDHEIEATFARPAPSAR